MGTTLALLCKRLQVLCHYQAQELCQHDGLSPYGPWDYWVTDTVFWKQPVNQPWLLIIVLFAGLFLSQISSPVQLAGSRPKAFSSRAEGQSKSSVGGRERNWELHQLALLFKGVLHFKAKQINSSNGNSSLDTATSRLVSWTQACRNLNLGMTIKAEEEKLLQVLRGAVCAQSWQALKEGIHVLVRQPPTLLGCPCREPQGDWHWIGSWYLEDPELEILVSWIPFQGQWWKDGNMWPLSRCTFFKRLLPFWKV